MKLRGQRSSREWGYGDTLSLGSILIGDEVLREMEGPASQESRRAHSEQDTSGD